MEEVKDLLLRRWEEIFLIPWEERQHWFTEYHHVYSDGLNAVITTLDLVEKLRSKRRGKKSKDKTAKKIENILDAAMAPGRGKRSLPKLDPTTGRIAMPAYKGLVEPEYKNVLRLLRDIHNDVRKLEKEGVRRNREIYRRLSSKTYYSNPLTPAIQKRVGQDPKLVDLARGAFPLEEKFSFEKFEELIMGRMTPRKGAIEIIANHFLIKPNTVVKILAS